MSKLEDFERQVMTALLAGDDPLLAALREQYAAATVKGREQSPSGFTTWFSIPPSAPPVERKLLHLDDLQVEIEGAETPVDAAVEVSGGRLTSLSCSLYEGQFPENPVITAAWYYGTTRHEGVTPKLMAERDLEDLLEDDE
ncbi:MAG TPA: hypothetical protein VEU30_09425 [Thermoanaerobaculia bacterium]|nr:hypothetical protein [Thermoanaerobaculia bacterium]